MKNKTLINLSLFATLLLSYGVAKAQINFLPSDSILVIKNSDTLSLAWAGGINSGQISTIDLDLDGQEDIVIFDRSDKRVIPLLNIGGPNEIKYKYAPEYIQQFPASIGWMLLRDFDLDDKKDVFYSNSGGAISVQKNNSITNLTFSDYLINMKSDQHPGGDIGIYIPTSDIPSISDIDNDGDLDILTFGVLGYALEYHRNMSEETYGNNDTLDYVLKNNCWGHFLEIGTNTNSLKLYDTCNYNVPNAEGGGNFGGGNRHAGSTVTAFDNNGDSVADLMLGDVSFNNIVMALNGGTQPGQNSSLTYQDTTFPSYDTSVNLAIFPGTFLEDIDNDGIKDLLVTTNATNLVENTESVWFYKNTGTNSIPNFNFKKKALFQDQMIELGNESIPAIFDHNGDGLMDLIVSNYGYFNRDSVTYDCKLSLYLNIGTVSKPVFEFVTDDYQNIFSLNLGTWLYPTFGDLDGDGDMDMVLGNSEGYLHYFTNSGGAGNPAVFTLTSSRIKDDLAATIDVGQFSAPQLFDYDNDNDLDLIIGKVNGWIRYYENTGTTTAYTFKKITDSLGRVELHEAWDIFGATTGYNAPNFFRNGSTVELYCGTHSGGIYKFTGINPSNPRQTFIIDTVIRNGEIGRRSSPAVYDFKNDGKLDMIIGNTKGGLNFYTQQNGFLTVKKIEPKIDFKLYPNPANESIFVELDPTESQNNTIRIYSITGNLIQVEQAEIGITTISVNNYAKGVYFLTVSTDKGQKTKRFVVQ